MIIFQITFVSMFLIVKKNLDVENDIKKAKRLVLEAIDHLRKINSEKIRVRAENLKKSY